MEHTAAPIPRLDVLGVQLSVVDMERSLREVERWITAGEPHYACLLNVHSVMECQHDDALRRAVNEAGLVLADGAPILWAGRRAGAGSLGRVRGPDLLLSLSQLAARRHWRCYFYGAAPGTADLLARRLSERYPGLEVVGSHSPPWRPLTVEEDAAVVQAINDARADIVWVGLSAPKQEWWMARHAGRIDAPVMAGVGAAFDIHAGLMPEAPRWQRAAGLEWLYRLAHEPRRLWRRYLRTNPAFVVRILRHPPSLPPGSGPQAPTPSAAASDR